MNAIFKSAIFALMAALLSSCGEQPQSTDTAKLDESAAAYVLKGAVSDQAYVGGEVIALSSKGEIVRSSISSTGEVNTALPGNESYVVHFLTNQSKSLFYTSSGAASAGPPAILSFEDDPSGALDDQLTLGAESAAGEIDLGKISIENGLASAENNPLEQLDSDNDGVDDYADGDDNNDGLLDSAEEKPEMDESALDNKLPFFVRRVWPRMNSLREGADTELKIRFSHVLKPDQDLESLLSLKDSKDKPVEIQIETSDNGRRLKLSPKNPLTLGEKYFLLVKKDLQSALGENLAGDFSSWFKVSNGDEQEKTPICHQRKHGDKGKRHTLEVAPEALAAHLSHGDSVGACADDMKEAKESKDKDSLSENNALELREAHPRNGAIDVNPNTRIEILFNEALDPATVQIAATSFQLQDDAGQSINGELKVAVGQRRISFKPEKALEPGAHYQLTLGTALRSSDGDSFSQDLKLEFTTSAKPAEEPKDRRPNDRGKRRRG